MNGTDVVQFQRLWQAWMEEDRDQRNKIAARGTRLPVAEQKQRKCIVRH